MKQSKDLDDGQTKRKSSFHVFAVVWTVSMTVIGYHISKSWSFPWIGNPDQDLVFMRDGLRLLNLNTPGYSDHPGLIQMLIGTGAHMLFCFQGTLASLVTGRISDPNQLIDTDWQAIFQTHKLLNGIAMASIIASCSHLLAKLFSKLVAMTWGIMTALSMGTTVLTYQLRNEFYSAFFFYIATLLLLIFIKTGNSSQTNQERNKTRFCTLSAASSLLYLCMLAKVQIIPLIAALNLGLFIAAMRLGARSRKEWFISFLKSSSLCVAVAFIIQHHAPSLSAVLLTASVLILILMPIITSCHLETQHRQLPKGEIVKEWIAFGLPTVAYTFLVARFNWQAISWDPYAMSRYKIDMNGSCTIACYAARMADGTLNLFERSFDGLIIAKVVSIALPVILLIGLVEFSNPISRRIALGSQRIGAIMAICLCGAAIAMSMISSMRWPVDHYLPYQQPLLYLGILVGAQYVWPKIYWKSLAAYTLISLALINFRYPPLALKTFVKYQPAQLSRRILINGTIYDNEPICWRQHAGPEWKQSILGRACNWH